MNGYSHTGESSSNNLAVTSEQTNMNTNNTNQTSSTENNASTTSHLLQNQNSTATDLNLANQLTQDNFVEHISQSLGRDLTRAYDISAINFIYFTQAQAEHALHYMLGETADIEIDPAIPNLCALRDAYSNFITISPRAADNPDFLVDGIYDDKDIQRALNIVWQNGGGMVFLYPGTYNIGRQINILDDTILKGSGRIGNRATILKLHNNSDNLQGKAGIVRMRKDFIVGDFSKGVYNATLEDLIIDGNKDNQSQDIDERKYGFYGEGDNLTIRRVTARNCPGYGFNPTSAKEAKPSKYFLIEDSYAHNNGKDGFSLGMLQESRFINNVSEYNGRHGINVSNNSTNAVIADSISRFNHATGMKLQNGADGMTFLNNQFHHNLLEGVFLRASDDNTFIHNIITANGKNGVRINGGMRNDFKENFISFNSTLGKDIHPAVLIGDYDGSSSSDPSHAQAINNVFLSNTFMLINENEVIIEINNAMWNSFEENNLWAPKRLDFRVTGDQSTADYNFIYSSE